MRTRDDYRAELRAYMATDPAERRRRTEEAVGRLRAENAAIEERRDAWRGRIGATSWTCDAGRPWR